MFGSDTKIHQYSAGHCDYHNGTIGTLCSGYGCNIQVDSSVGGPVVVGGSSLTDTTGVLTDDQSKAGTFTALQTIDNYYYYLHICTRAQ